MEEQELIVLRGIFPISTLIMLELVRRQNRKQSKHGTGEQVNRMNDLISRIAVHDRVDRIVNVNHLDPEKVWFTPIGVKALIEEMPSAQPEPQWIQCSERLPETDEFVLVSLSGRYKNIRFEHACEIADYADNEWFINAYPRMTVEIANDLIEAWMPLPEPYKEVKKNDLT